MRLRHASPTQITCLINYEREREREREIRSAGTGLGPLLFQGHVCTGNTEVFFRTRTHALLIRRKPTVDA